MHDIAGTIARDARDEPQPLEGLPEFAPARLHLIGGQNPVGIGADGEEGGVAEVEEPGKADDDVEPERQDGEGARIGGRVDVAVIVIDQRKERREDEKSGHQQPTALHFGDAQDRLEQRGAQRPQRRRRRSDHAVTL